MKDTMEYIILKPRKALNKAFLKVKPSRSDIERFKTNLAELLDNLKEGKFEEFHKNLLIDFLKKTYYAPDHFINTKDHNDLVIHNGKNANSSVGVIIETKNPANKNEMLRTDKINTKALQELLLYYLRERITNKNLEIRYLIATNFQEWFIFDAQVFEQKFAQNKDLVQKFREFEDGRLAGKKTEYFYKEVAQRFIDEALGGLDFTYVDLRDYEKSLRSADKDKDTKLIPLFKLFSPEHLLKLPFSNDSNTLDKRFYSELLHIIGLTERKEKGKKLIERKAEDERNSGSLIENAIVQLHSLDKLSRFNNPNRFGDNHQERLFNVALQLALTWTNRVLFLKLLEAQLISYHKGDHSYAFLNLSKVGDYDDLNSLFFEVLARTPVERSSDIQKAFGKVPYLNSSLFEPTWLEQDCFCVSQIKTQKIPVLKGTVLKDRQGRKRTGEMDSLEYLFEFLDAYDFTSEGAEEIQEENKALISASVLGLIFEKINGYKDGSYFTPGFITMYMCRETIRRAVLQKFNEKKSWDCKTIAKLYDRIEDKKEANEIINSLRICDPAVGSGHFLVSALNEIIALKSELKILLDRDGKTLRDYVVEVVNDELVITDSDGGLFEYRPGSAERQRVQETLFHEKQTIIENCLFGVDINPNSVKICRLRLWIELLKNTYYKTEDELETLPNIDINIKCGNSLISRFDLDADLKKALKKSKRDINVYRLAVMSYRNAESKEMKREMGKLIDEIKNSFEAEIHANDPRVVRLQKERSKLFELTQDQMFELSKREKAAWNKKVQTHSATIDKLETEIEEIKNNKIYEDAFEWRFEFPEVLDDDGKFVGFDCIIGNPPYIRQEEFKTIKPYLKQGYKTFTGMADLYVYFIELGMRNLRPGGTFSFITPNKWMRATYGKPLRNFIKENRVNSILDFGDLPVFEEATTYPCILSIDKAAPQPAFKAVNITTLSFPTGLPAYLEENQMEVLCDGLHENGWTLSDSKSQKLMAKLHVSGKPLGEYVEGKLHYGIKTGFNEAFVIDRETRDRLIVEDPKSDEIIKPFLRGRDVKRWSVNFAEQYLIKIESSENKNHPWSGLEDKDAEMVFAQTYPAVYGFMRQYFVRLNARYDQGKYFWELRSCAYYSEFTTRKLIYPDLAVRAEFAVSDEVHYADCTLFVSPIEKSSLVGFLNSAVVGFFLKSICPRVRGDFMRFKTVYVSQIPIPATTPVQQSEIEERVEKILALKKENPEVDVSELEVEIDQLVYKLYDLTEEEIAIVEKASAGSAHKMTKPLLKEKILPELKKLGNYFCYEDAKTCLAEAAESKVPDSTLKIYLSQFAEQGILFDAGKGWYSNLSEPLTLNSDSLTKLTTLLSDQFPLLEFSCWSTEQINSFMHHLLSKFVTFVYTDADAMETVGDVLSDAGYNVLVNPGKDEIEKFYGKTEFPVIVRASVTKEPAAVSGMSPPEKLLVDLLFENNKLMIMEPSEADDVVKKAVQTGRVNMAALLSYAKRKRVLLSPENIY